MNKTNIYIFCVVLLISIIIIIQYYNIQTLKPLMTSAINITFSFFTGIMNKTIIRLFLIHGIGSINNNYH